VCQLQKAERPEHRAVEHPNERGSQGGGRMCRKGAKMQITGSRLIVAVLGAKYMDLFGTASFYEIQLSFKNSLLNISTSMAQLHKKQ
jgi:hypothetical protein